MFCIPAALPSLWDACRRGRTHTVASLLQNMSTPVDIRNATSETPLLIASRHGHLEIVQALLQAGASVNSTNRSGETPLHVASENGHVDVVNELLMVDATAVDVTDINGRSSLFRASEKGHVGVVNALLARKANPDSADVLRMTPLFAASQLGHLDVVNALLQNNARVDVVEDHEATSLYIASQNGYIDIVAALLESGANVDLQRVTGATPLHAASRKGHLEIVRALLAHDPNVDLSDVNGVTPLYLASQIGYGCIVSTLLKHGASVDLANANGVAPLFVASQYGHLDVVKALIKSNANVNPARSDGATPLFTASQIGHIEAVVGLLANTANADSASADVVSPLYVACQNGHLSIVNELLHANASVNLPGADGFTPLSIAAKCGHLGVVKALLKRNADVNLAIANGWTPLHFAALTGQVDVVETLLASNAKVDAVSFRGETPIHIASFQGHDAVVNVLLEYKACVDQTNAKGVTPLNIASSYGHLNVVRTLLKNNASVDIPAVDGTTPLINSSEEGHLDVVMALLQMDADVDSRDVDGSTPLFFATQEGHVKVVQALLKNNASVNLRNKHGESPLSVAADRGQLNIVKELVSSGAKLDQRVANGDTSLHCAAGGGFLDVVQTLLDCGADLMARSFWWETPLLHAAHQGHTEVVRELLSRGSQIDVGDVYGDTPLIAASRNGHMGVVKVLLKSGASLSAVNESGETALIAAGSSGHFQTWELLITAGASVHVRADNGDTPLLSAARIRHLSAVSVLGQHGWVPPMSSQVSLFPASLQSLSDCGTQMHEFQDIWDGGVKRLVSLHTQLEQDQELWRSAIHEYIMLIFSIMKIMTSCEKGTKIIRLAASRGILSAFEDFHTEIAYFQRKFNLEQEDPKTWTTKWESDQINLLASFWDSINDDHHFSILLGNLNQSQTIVRLQYEISVHGDKCDPEMLKLLQAALDKVERCSNVTAPSTPAWFIPPSDLYIDQEDETKGPARGKWQSASVMVSKCRMSHGQFVREADRWHDLRFPNVIRFLGASDISSPYVAVFEDVLHTNLREYLVAGGNSELLWQKLYEVAQGLEYLHKHGVILGVLSCDHVWVGTDGRAKIYQFGVDSPNDSDAIVRWQAPECIRGGKPSAASNVYSLAMCILEAATGKVPWSEENEDTLVKFMVLQGVQPNVPPGYFAGAQRYLLEKMSHGDPSKRVELATVIEELKRYVMLQKQREDEAKHDNTVAVDPDNRSHSLSDQYFFDLGSSIPDFVKKLEIRCGLNRGSFPEAAEHVYRRVVDVFTLLQEAHKRPHDIAVVNYCQVLKALDRFLEIAVSESSLLQQAKSRQVIVQNDVFHRDIDALLSLLTIPDVEIDPIHKWTPYHADKEEIPTELHREVQQEGGEAMQINCFVSEHLNQKFKPIDFHEIRNMDLLGGATQAPSWFIPFYDIKYTPDDIIATGAFGEVYTAKWRGTDVVVKCVGYEGDEKDAYKQELFLHELRVWHPLNHPHVIKLYGACHIGKRYFVCEVADHGTLLEYLKRDDNITKKWRMLFEAASGLKYLHSQNVVHNDLKCDNILVGAECKAKITDFGMSCILNSAEVSIRVKNQGALHWRSPEYLRGERSTLASDIYSFGMCILEAVTGEPPWAKTLDSVARFNVGRGRLPPRPTALSDSQWSLIEMMCAKEPAQRVKILFVEGKLYEFVQQESISLTHT